MPWVLNALGRKRPTAQNRCRGCPLKLKGNWQRAINQSLAKKKPPEGWPK